MQYKNIISAVFLERPNRFIAHVEVDGTPLVVHVKNTGRCRELLVPGARVYLEKSENPARKTAYDLVAVEKERPGLSPLLINMDAQIPNDVAEEWLCESGLFSPAAVVRREVTFGASRFDFYIEDGTRRAFLEVKGVTLEKNGIAAFPDAPTERGIKHIRELASAFDAGFEAYLLFVIQMSGIKEFRPNDVTHRAFGDALRDMVGKIKMLAIECRVTPEDILPGGFVPIVL